VIALCFFISLIQILEDEKNSNKLTFILAIYKIKMTQSNKRDCKNKKEMLQLNTKN